jgi:hypothetical protein
MEKLLWRRACPESFFITTPGICNIGSKARTRHSSSMPRQLMKNKMNNSIILMTVSAKALFIAREAGKTHRRVRKQKIVY